jgi:transcriptional regulator with XRE-family HTH domain
MDRILTLTSPHEMANKLAGRLRQKRLAATWSREELSRRSGVTVASIKHFELTGTISLHRLLALCLALNAIDDFDRVLLPSPAVSIQELKKSLQTRQRGRRQRR